MQVSYFTNGDFVIHKIMIGKQKYSAWFRIDGELVDAERITDRNCHKVSLSHTKVRTELGKIGKRLVGK